MRLIDADELLKALKKEFRQNNYIKHDSYFEFKNIVETMPTVEQKHGQWQGVSPFVDSLECSECRYEILSEELKTPYCPWCGAKMDEVTE